MSAGLHPFLDRPFVAMAHRGGWLSQADPAPENTRQALAQSVALGYEYFETDVRLTADGEVVVFHDESLDRVTDASGPIGQRRWAELAEVRVGGSEPIPRLADLLDEFPATRFNIDLKEPGVVEPLAELIRRHRAEQRVCVASFSGARLRNFRRSAPEVLTAVSPSGVAWYGFAPLLRRLPVDAGAVLQVPERVLRDRVRLVRRDVVAAVHATGRRLHVWTVDDESSMERLIAAGVDGIITNNVTALRTVLQAHGLWTAAT